MILSDCDIERALRQKKILIDPFPLESQFTTSALDLYLGDDLFELKTPEELNQEEPQGVRRSLIIDASQIVIKDLLAKYSRPMKKESDGSFILEPHKFVLGNTREYVGLPEQSKIAARVEGRSTLARLGLVVHLTAPTIHVGFHGRIVLEMYNFGTYPLQLHPQKLRICQLIFEQVKSVPKRPFQSWFKGQRGVR